MIKQLTAYITVAVASWIMSLQAVTAMNLMPHKQLITTKAKTLIEQQVAQTGKSSAWQMYAQLKSVYTNEKNPYVRATLYEIMSRIDTSYWTSKLAATTSTLKSWKRVFLKDGKPFEVTSLPQADSTDQQESEHSVAIDLEEENVEHVSLEVEGAKQPDTDNGIEEEQVQEPARSGKDEYYTLKRGRINLSSLQKERLERVNEVRARPDLQRNPLTLEPALDKTASQWAQVMRNRWNASHERTEGDGYYNYAKIDQWFADKGVRFAYQDWATFTENIGYAWFDCDEDDCTDVALESMHRIFEFFIGEEGAAYDAHWKTTVHPLYKQVGIGISVDEANNRIYMAAHYATKVIKEPVSIAGS
jgi:uncharacterized protein YkwD